LPELTLVGNPSGQDVVRSRALGWGGPLRWLRDDFSFLTEADGAKQSLHLLLWWDPLIFDIVILGYRNH
jgi:hypothetical protein